MPRPQKSKTKNLDKLLKESQNKEIHEPLAEEATGAQTAKDKRYHKISEEKGDRHQVQQAVPPTTHW